MSSAHSSPTRRRSPRFLELPALWAGAALVVGSAAAAAQSSPYYVAGSLSLTQDSNLLRLADDQSPTAGNSRSDTVYSTSLIGGMNQPLGRGRVYGSLTLRDNRFARNEVYDNQSYNGSLGLDWATAQRVSGSLSTSAVRALSTFNADGIGQLDQKNLETTQSTNAVVRVGLVTAFSLELAGGVRRVRNSLDDDRVVARNFNQESLSLGLVWRPGGALSVSTAIRQVNGEYPNFRRDTTGEFVSDRFRQQFVDLITTWQPTGASSLDLRLSFADTKSVVDEQRNFSAVNGSLGWLWQPTGKLRLSTRYASDRGQDAYPSSIFFSTIPVTLFDSRQIGTWRLQADLEVSAKVSLNTSLQVARRALTRDTVIVANGASVGITTGRDNTTTFSLGSRWMPTRSILLGCDAGNEERKSSGDLSFNLKSATLNCFGQLTLQ